MTNDFKWVVLRLEDESHSDVIWEKGSGVVVHNIRNVDADILCRAHNDDLDFKITEADLTDISEDRMKSRVGAHPLLLAIDKIADPEAPKDIVEYLQVMGNMKETVMLIARNMYNIANCHNTKCYRTANMFPGECYMDGDGEFAIKFSMRFDLGVKWDITDPDFIEAWNRDRMVKWEDPEDDFIVDQGGFTIYSGPDAAIIVVKHNEIVDINLVFEQRATV